jgi:hypothetical protein
MRRAMRRFLLLGPVSLAASMGSACAARPAPAAMAAPAPHAIQVFLHDHLGFGVRLEHVSLLLDGGPAHETSHRKAPLELADLAVEPGAHTLAVLAEASEPCGLFDEPRMRVSIRVVQTFVVGEGPATLDVDLYPSAATSDPAHMVSVRLTGARIALGAKPEGDAPPPAGQCEPGDEVCVLDARIDGARSRGDTERSACYASHRDEMRRWSDLLEDSFAAASREGTTTRDAESAQLRARYAESRLRASVVEARACASDTPVRAAPVEIERRIVAACTAPDVTPSVPSPFPASRASL